jgi:glycosyltransferase involved in cell wall biosynthesis
MQAAELNPVTQVATSTVTDNRGILEPLGVITQGLLRDSVVVIPALNEEESLGHLLRDLKVVLPETKFLVVDGNSTDRTREVAELLGTDVILQIGKGKGAALRQALALDLKVGNVIIMDADRSMSPHEIPALVDALRSGADMVKGSRFLPGGSSEDLSLLRRFGAHLFVGLVNWIWSRHYSDLCYGFLALKADAVRRLHPYLTTTNFEIETEMCIKAAKLGLTVAEVPSKELMRFYGRSHLFLVRDGFLILKTILREWFVGQRSVTSNEAIGATVDNPLSRL